MNTTDTRNVSDFYKHWETLAIKGDLDTKRHNFSVLCTNIQGDFNLATIVRNANAFLAKEVIIYGKKKWDRRGAVGTQNYTNFKHVRILEDLKDLKLPIVAIDNVDGAEDITTFSWPQGQFIMAFGEEMSGVPPELLEISDHVVYIPQYGSVRSLNVGVAAGIAMFDFCSKMQRT
jgi:tRNA G18 (ribose-2'-O)-methylase SpoU